MTAAEERSWGAICEAYGLGREFVMLDGLDAAFARLEHSRWLFAMVFIPIAFKVFLFGEVCALSLYALFTFFPVKGVVCP